jgi:hypothetical protein
MSLKMVISPAKIQYQIEGASPGCSVDDYRQVGQAAESNN